MQINDVTHYEVVGEIAVATLNSPPVNALSQRVRIGINEAVEKAVADPSVKAMVLICEGRTFFAGADITEFGTPSQGGLRWLSRAVLLYSPCA